MFFRYAPRAVAALLLASSIAACGGESTASSSDDVTVRSTSAALSLVDDLHPQVTSFDPLRIFFPGGELKAKLEAELLAALQANGIHEKEKRLTIEEVNVDIGDGEITVKAKGKGGVRSCAIGCTGWMDTTIRAEVTVGLGVRNWIVTAQHRHTDVSASNDFADALVRTFRGRVYPPINDGIKKALASVDGQDLRAQLEAALGVPVPANAIVNAIVSPAGLTLEAKDAPPPVERERYLGAGETMGPGDSVRAANGAIRLVMQGDGNLVVYCGSKPVPLWSSSTAGQPVDVAAMQGDGNFVLYAQGTPVWHTSTDGNPGTVLAVQDDGNVVLYAPGTRPVWQTATNGSMGLCAP